MQTSLSDVFRFIRLGATTGPELDAAFQRTQFFITLEHETPERRRQIAIDILGGSSREVVRRIEDLALGAVIHAALVAILAGDDRTVGAFLAALPPGLRERPEFAPDLKRLSDTLL